MTHYFECVRNGNAAVKVDIAEAGRNFENGVVHGNGNLIVYAVFNIGQAAAVNREFNFKRESLASESIADGCGIVEQIAAHFNACCAFEFNKDAFGVSTVARAFNGLKLIDSESVGAAGSFNALKEFAGYKFSINTQTSGNECSGEVDFNPAAMCDLRRGHGCAVNGNRCDIAETNAVSGDGESNLVELGCGRFNRAGECNVVELDAVIAAVYTAVLAVGPFKGVCAVGSCGVGIGCESDMPVPESF